VIVFSLCTVLPAFAHKVIVFAWVENDTIFVESKFHGGKKVKEGGIIVTDTSGKELLSGKTDDKGNFSFPVPGKTAMKIAVIAGMGHRGEWEIEKEELTGGPVKGKLKSQTKPAELNAENMATSDIAREELKRIVETAVEAKMKPVMQQLAMSRKQKEPSFPEIMGGIGYIFGLMGVGAYLHYRKKALEINAREMALSKSFLDTNPDIK